NALGVNLVIAKKTREVGVAEFLEESYIPSSSGVMMSLYIPKNAIRPNCHILIVDDVIRSGETQSALMNLVKKAGAKVEGIVILVSIGNMWRKELHLPSDCLMEILAEISPPRK
ncbi:MAG: phosphoribosyltransferase family protein, partial [Candidatus Odinarchaeia archaeon]